ncbi:MAG: hypothetical protein AB7D06_13300 [Pedobacter sp.]
MKSKRSTEEQIIGILKQAQAGMKIVDLWRMHYDRIVPQQLPVPGKTVKGYGNQSTPAPVG